MTRESNSVHPLDHKFPPPLVALFVAGTMWVGARVAPVFHVGQTFRFAPAAAFAVVALSFVAPAMMAFRRARTTINPVEVEAASSLVTSGVYRWTRNPMYVGLTSLLLAWTVWLASPVVLLGPMLLVLFTTRFQIIPEERVMRAKFGHDFDAYAERVRRWL